jgi:hypothetical protein
MAWPNFTRWFLYVHMTPLEPIFRSDKPVLFHNQRLTYFYLFWPNLENMTGLHHMPYFGCKTYFLHWHPPENAYQHCSGCAYASLSPTQAKTAPRWPTHSYQMYVHSNIKYALQTSIIWCRNVNKSLYLC